MRPPRRLRRLIWSRPASALRRRRVGRARLRGAVGAGALAVIALTMLSVGSYALSARGKPDLVTTAVSAAVAQPAAGGVIKIRYRLWNRGKVAAKPTATGFYLSADSRRSRGDYRFRGRRRQNRLKPEGRARGRAKLAVPSKVPRGVYFVLVCADDTKQVRERSERNNCRGSRSAVGLPGAPQAPPAPGGTPPWLSPETTISSAPPELTNATAASFAFSTSEPGSRFECQLDTGRWWPCSSPATYSGLGEGSHTFGVRAIDGAGNTDASPAWVTWRIDTTAPQTTITAGPAGTIGSSSASFGFSSSESGSSFECRLDSGTWVGCSSPKALSGLSDGEHNFAVRAKDSAGNTDQSPAARSWTVQRPLTPHMDEISEHVYRGGASQAIPDVDCGPRCAALWAAEHERMPNRAAPRRLHGELFELRQRIHLLPPPDAMIAPVATDKSMIAWTFGTDRAKWLGVEAPPPSEGRAGEITRALPAQAERGLASGGSTSGDWALSTPTLGLLGLHAEDDFGVWDFVWDHDPGWWPSCDASTAPSLEYPGWSILRGPVYTLEINCGTRYEHFETPFFPFLTLRPDGTAPGAIEDLGGQPVSEPAIEWWADQPGTWEMLRSSVIAELEGHARRYPTLIQWYRHQYDSAVPDPMADDDGVSELAERFRPILRFDSREPWRPLNVERFLEEDFDDGQPGTHHEICSSVRVTPESCSSIDDGDAAGSPEAWTNLRQERGGVGQGKENWPVISVHGEGDDIDNFKSPRLSDCFRNSPNDCDVGENTAMYYRKSGPFPGDANYRFLDYWVFYRFNKFDTGDHEADWEHITVAIAPSGEPETFAWVGLSGHKDYTFRYLRDVLRCDDDLAAGSCGSEIGDELGKRVVSFVSNGGHANYPEPCSSPDGAARCPQSHTVPGTDIPRPEKGYDGYFRWGAADDPSALIRWPEQLPAWTADTSQASEWVTWPGRWGLRNGKSSVESPGAPSRDVFHRPWSWECSERGTDGTVNCDDGATGSGSGASSSSSARAAANANVGECAPWAGPGVVVSWCDPSALRSAMRRGTLGRTTEALKAQVGGRNRLVASTKALTQIAGPALETDRSLVIRGSIPAGAEVRIMAKGKRQLITARFAPARKTLRNISVRFLRPGDARSLVIDEGSTNRRPRSFGGP